MGRNEEAVLEILNAIDRARSGSASLDELETNVWRLPESPNLPPILGGRLENFVQELRHLRRENLAFAVDPDRGADALFNEVTGALSRYLG